MKTVKVTFAAEYVPGLDTLYTFPFIVVFNFSKGANSITDSRFFVLIASDVIVKGIHGFATYFDTSLVNIRLNSILSPAPGRNIIMSQLSGVSLCLVCISIALYAADLI